MQTDASSLGPLITLFAGLCVREVEIENGLLLQRPIVRLGDAHVVAIPGMLLPAVRHWIICSAITRGLSKEIAHALHLVVGSHVRDLLKLSSCPPVFPPISNPKLMPFQSESFFSLDTDKILHVLVTTDSLEDYDPRDSFGTVDASKAESRLTARIKKVRSFMRSRKRIRGVLSLVVSQGVGRTSWYDGTDPDSTEDNHLLRFSAEALELVTLLDGENQLYLWQFAVARDAAFSDTSVFITDTLSEYGLFRAHNSSFYLSDKAAPNGLWIASDYGDKIRVEYCEKLDLHTAPAYWQSGLVEVALLRRSRKVPVYFPFRSPPPIPSFLVEGFACPVWVAASTEEGRIGDAHTEIAESIAYWLWQLSPTIAPVISARLTDMNTLLIHIAIEPLIPNQSRKTPRIEDLVITTDRRKRGSANGEAILVALPSAFIVGCRHPENDYERLLCTAVLRGLAKLGDEESPLLDEPTIRLAIDRHIPHGRKKHLVAIEASKGSSLDPSGLPRLRDVQDANRNSVADRLGLHLRKKLSLPVGPIENEMLEKVLKECTSYCFTEIARLVDELSPRSGILERLILQHEACIHGRRRFELHLVPREQCYGDVFDIPRERFEAEQQFSQVDPALRFLIEYVAANPPAGRKILSLSLIDELVALASYLIDYGMECDYIHHDLVTLNYSMLPSGRLGSNRAEFVKMREAYFAEFVAANSRRTQLRYDRYWTPHAQGQAPSSSPEEFERACKAEYGFSISQVESVLAELAALAFEHEPGVAAIPLTTLISQLQDRLGLDRRELLKIIEITSLNPRDDFLNPPLPHKKSDVYPWVFGRSLSYLYRPLIGRRHGTRNELVIGPRHTLESIVFIWSLLLGKRQNPKSPELRALVEKNQKSGSDEFVDQVHRAFEERGFWARKNVEKEIPGFRNLGDIDVFVVDKSAKKILLVECKDLEFGRTPAELRNEVDRLFEDQPRRKSEVQKHLNRLAWTKANLDSILTHFELDLDSNWDVLALMVTSGELFGPFLRKSPLLVLSFHKLGSISRPQFWPQLRELIGEC